MIVPIEKLTVSTVPGTATPNALSVNHSLNGNESYFAHASDHLSVAGPVHV